jgi:hypothetical protein
MGLHHKCRHTTGLLILFISNSILAGVYRSEPSPLLAGL